MSAKTPTIDSFKGQYSFLSNFSSSPMRVCEIRFPTVEHAFQAMKTTDAEQRVTVANLATPGEAKKAGRRLKLREDWEQIKVDVMRELLIIKFHPWVSYPKLTDKLIATAPAKLIEGNTWGDKYWGMVNGEGRNELGKLLMEVRDLVAGLPR
jgi:ribA/ribD-fused uncharacterized protein